MRIYEDIIEFLYRKALLINQGFQDANTLMDIALKKRTPMSFQKIVDEAKVRQKYIKNTFLLITKLTLQSKDKNINKKIELYLNKLADDVIIGNSTYDENHILYGFEPLKTRILKKYMELEEYEKCTELNIMK